MWAKKKQQVELGLHSLPPIEKPAPAVVESSISSVKTIKSDQSDQAAQIPRGPNRRIYWTESDSREFESALQIFGKGKWTKIEDYLEGKMDSPRKCGQLKDR
jgi:hypothetical protein